MSHQSRYGAIPPLDIFGRSFAERSIFVLQEWHQSYLMPLRKQVSWLSQTMIIFTTVTEGTIPRHLKSAEAVDFLGVTSTGVTWLLTKPAHSTA
ncbi:hypothetical protein TNCV_4172281 [Trichonephila clavipes]|nr:hypothetical protein TNCV_4172281 [Trichonephila clavipes]